MKKSGKVYRNIQNLKEGPCNQAQELAGKFLPRSWGNCEEKNEALRSLWLWRPYGDLGIDKADTSFNNQFETGMNSIGTWYVLSTSRIRAGHTATQFPILPGGHDKDSWQSLMTGNVLPCVERCCFLQGVSGFWIFVVPVWLQMFGGYPAMLNGLMVSKLEFMSL